MKTLKPAPPVRIHSSGSPTDRNIVRLAPRIVSGREVAKVWRKIDVTVNLSGRKCLISASFKHDTATLGMAKAKYLSKPFYGVKLLTFGGGLICGKPS